jgi:carbamoyltransferase
MQILGVSCFYHDAAACVLRDGVILAAAEEERFSRQKHDSGYPGQAIRYCLEMASIVPEELDYVIFYEKPLLKCERILASYGATFPRSRQAFVKAMQVWLSEKLWIEGKLRRELSYSGPILFGEHHLSHAGSAYYVSPFDEAAVVTADGVGEWCTTTIGHGQGVDLALLKEIQYPHSLGLLYSAFTAYLGFEVNEGEYKVMGMAAYGQPRYADEVRRLIRLADDGSFELDLRYFAYHRSLQTLSDDFYRLFGPPRPAEGELDQKYADIAASIQLVTEDAMVAIARHARELTGSKNLCLAGGVALNCVANTRILREAGFERIYVQPAAGDSGGCIGAAGYLYHTVLRQPRTWVMDNAYLGPGYSDDEIRAFLEGAGIAHTRLESPDLVRTVARLLAEGNIVGWFQGRMEFGPRALGSRSILADPRGPDMKDKLNEKIKHREQFRPFAPSVLAEAAPRYFDLDTESPFMLLVASVHPDMRTAIPAVTHADGTARLQTVTHEQNPLYYELIEAFGQLTGTPVLINTSFNVRGEPIVCTPAEAYDCFAHTEIDYLVLGSFLISRESKRPLNAYPGRALVHQGQEVVV